MSDKRRVVVFLVCAGFLSFGIKNFVHEGIGHGGASWLMGCEAKMLTSAFWDSDCDRVYDPNAALIVRKAGGTFANLLLFFAALVALALARVRSRSKQTDLESGAFFLWLLMVTNGLSGFGYLMVDPLLGFGDWDGVLELMDRPVGLRWSLVAIGVVGSLATFFVGLRMLLPWSDGPLHRRWMSLVPYFAGATLVTVSAALNPLGPKFLITSALANFAGCGWMIWIAFQPSKHPEQRTGSTTRYHLAFVVAGILCVILFFAILGPGVSFD